jgi:hypothetical protein
MGDIYSLDTPEHVSVGYDVAGVGSRFLAALIDALVLAAVLAATHGRPHVRNRVAPFVAGASQVASNVLGARKPLRQESHVL